MTRTTREQLIDIGLRLIHKNGYTATGVKQILDAAGIPKGSFYHHFSSKEEFAKAVLQQFASREAERWDTLLKNEKIAPLKRLRLYFEELITVFGQTSRIPGCLLGNLSLEVAAHIPSIQSLLSKSFAHWQEAVAAVLRSAVMRKELPRSTNPVALASFLLNSWEGALIRSKAEKSNEPLNGFMRFVFDKILNH